MRITMRGSNAANGWCVYTLHDAAGKLVFIWCSRISNVLSWRDVLSNPAFDNEALYTCSIVQIFNTMREAQHAVSVYMQQNGAMPELNKTVRWNRRTRIICHETGQTFRNQLDCAKQLGINQSQLSQHLRRSPGFKSIKGLTFSNITAGAGAIQPVQYP